MDWGKRWQLLIEYLEQVRNRGLELDIDEELLDEFETRVKQEAMPF